jgi:DNA-binding response OmpR family regulator
MQARILWIEGKRAEGPSFIPGLRKKGFLVEIVNTGNEAVARLGEIDPDLVIVNVASLRSNGKRICRSIRDRASNLPIVMIAKTDLPGDAPKPGDGLVNVVLTLPFTLRKLLNHIAPFLPEEGGQLLHVGPIRLDVEHRRVRCQSKEGRLTPRLVHLLKLLMEHVGEVMERQRLFREVWKTEYTGDTRTLDVHISWLRDIIEENPRQPHYLKTIRGVGYRLDV